MGKVKKNYQVYIGSKRVLFHEKPEKTVNFENNFFPFFPTSAELDKIVLKNTKNTSKIREFSKHYKFLIRSLKDIYRFQRAAGGLVWNTDNQILFIRRNNKWDLPKGGMEVNETKKQTALRETEEETGLKNLTIIGKLSSTYHTFWRSDNFVLKKTKWYEMLYEGNETPVPQEEEGITEARWFSRDEIPEIIENTYPAIQHLVEEALKMEITEDKYLQSEVQEL
jgi:8-oxo-dGTP pyrophosphatase MutT (NUDIX family)